VTANGTGATATVTWCGCGGESSRGVKCGAGNATVVLARQLAVQWRPGTREMHRTPGPESGCNKPEDRDSDRAVEAGKNRMDGPRRRVAPPAEGWLASWDVERVAERRWRGTSVNLRRGESVRAGSALEWLLEEEIKAMGGAATILTSRPSVGTRRSLEGQVR
jgi:hypothetical protein